MKKIVLILILGITLILGGIAFYYFSQPPKDKLSDRYKEQAIEKLLGRKANINPEKVKTGDAEFKGKYITFKYPAKAVVYKYQDPSFKKNDTRLEDFSFDIKSPRLVFNLQVLQDTSNLSSIVDYPGVRLREVRSEYKRSDITIGDTKGKVYFNSSSQAEKTGFFLKNEIIYSISITGSDADEVSLLFDNIIRTVSFSI